MKIAVIGAGFTGLAASLELVKRGHTVTVFEKDAVPGGLAVGFDDKDWNWSLEKHYHHLFESDWAIRNLASEVNHEVLFRRPITSTLIDGKTYQLDSASSLLKFPGLSFVSRVRTGIGLALLKFNPFWKPLEKITAKSFITSVMGAESWNVLWNPLFMGKFGKFAPEISASWFWSRIYKRSQSLGYPVKGFLALAKSIEKASKKAGTKFVYAVGVDKISKNENQAHIELSLSNKSHQVFDKVICTLPTPLFSKISGIEYPRAVGLGAVNLVLALKKSFLKDGSYWLNINQAGMPFLAIVEHTNYMDEKNYNGDKLLYIGNYLAPDHKYFSLSDTELLKEFLPYLLKIDPEFDLSWVRKSWVWKAPFAQPVVTRNYSKNIPAIKTAISGVYLANIQQVYPWDRGTNYAVELGIRTAKYAIKEN